MYGQFFRNAFTPRQQGIVRSATFAIIGLGGTGGFILENLLRMGAERFIIFDHDRFELTNFNRQLLATIASIDEPKADAALARAKDINPSVKMDMRGEFNAHSSFAGMDLLLDGSDNLKTKLAAAKLAEGKKIPYVLCSASGTRGIVSVFRNYSFRKAFQVSGEGKGRQSSRILCPAAALAGTLAASQAVNCLIGKPFVRAPDALFFDIFSKRLFWRARLG
ncbi:MAG: ThiF family adenylyltransferase [Candidatus ainarchaeum sp.]|nr:ThiF family adenylyltransferase [Candidatus ainarchaeum sp.]